MLRPGELQTVNRARLTSGARNRRSGRRPRAPMPSASLGEFNIRSQFNMNPCSRLWRHADRSQRICAIVREQSNRAAFLATKYASPRLPPIPPHAWPIFLSSLQRIRYLDLETIGSIGRVSSQIRCRSIRLPPTKPVYAQRRIRGVRDQGDAAGRGWGVSVSNQESNRVARARRKRERVEQGVTHRDFALDSLGEH